jgi:glycerophosphoryl diester phosphodiesterase
MLIARPLRATLIAVVAVLASGPVAVAATPQLHAHRGGTVANGKAQYPEEGLVTYRHAARNGFVLEVDAKLTEDGVPVAIHDATLDRTTNCSGELRTFTLAELASCRIDFPAGKPAPVITIAKLLDYAKRSGSKVNLEIKNVPTDPDYDTTPAFANRVMDAVVSSQIPRRQLIIQSFIPANLDVARQRLPGVTTSLLALQSINEAFLEAAADNDYDVISPEWPVSPDYVRRAHGLGLDVAPFTLDTAADVRAAAAARVDALITDDPLMAARALGLRPARFFDATVFIDGRRLITVVHLLGPRGVSARQTCRGKLLMRIMAGGRTRLAEGRLSRNCEARFGTKRTPARLGPPLVTVLFEGNARVLPELEGPKRALPKPPSFNP